MTRNSFSDPWTPRILSLCNSCTTPIQIISLLINLCFREAAPMSPENRLKVLGILTLGLTSINTPLEVSIYTCSNPALLSGESRSVSKH